MREYDENTDILARDLKKIIYEDRALLNGKLRVDYYRKGYGATLKWGVSKIAEAYEVILGGMLIDGGKIYYAFDKKDVKKIIEDIRNGKTCSVFTVWVGGGTYSKFATKEEAEKVFHELKNEGLDAHLTKE